jgi:2-polyprenyl-6-methoxyphenol hydroxylase-like FAD-dependent oxidoreductase
VLFRSEAREPAIAWTGRLAHPANAVDQRLRVAAWLEEFCRRGGEIRYAKATAEALEEFAREFELVVVATGRGPQFGQIFPRNDGFSPYREPQRAIGAFYARVPEESLTNSMRYAMGPAGELAITPALLAGGPALGVGMFGIPGGPLDVWDAVLDTEHHLETARKLVEAHFPWRAGILEHAEPTGPLDSLRGDITPIVRHPVGVLPSGVRVLALGDAAVTTDPLSGQGGNLAGHAARAYRDAIVAHGDRAFDEEFMHAAFARYWAHARNASRFNNDLLAPPSERILATFQAAQQDPAVADRFVRTFENPDDYPQWLTDDA